ncbi:TetR/AcrR family transcriptional regulator [Kibdelosporangium philippinense]|uniref:TetR/AcrR family transcriptional regulator n=1 Tax=Kibdelosporangium philippinense TaxID=211113 RepID=A0ABS8Z5R4_9PSEU|nr:TetR/AcrR family transcriptional regulator [Kibdelosporangium philippinense]MCE7003226.1 TetR/AcrR family transcriptional regulator [Kibdelosporangium philippinense]
MPKRVDHEQRRRQIADAVRGIVADQGLEAVSIGTVATAAGISKGLVQHYFPTREAMLRYTTATLRDHVENQVRPEFAGGLPGLRAALIALLPLGAHSRVEALVANAFVVHALKDPEIAERFRVGHSQLREAVAAMIAAAQADGDLDSQLDATQEADLLLALVSGLGDAVLLGHRSAAEATSLVDHHLSRLRSSHSGNMLVLPTQQYEHIAGWDGAEAPTGLTTRARIGNAALAQFSQHGYAGTSLRMVAEAAGVSVGLVQHHFGTKADLRAACDAYVTEYFQASSGDFLAEAYRVGPQVLDYLARILVEGSPGAASLFDNLVAQHLKAAPSQEDRTVAAVLTAMKLGIPLLRDHLARVLRIGDAEERWHEIAKAMLAIVSPAVLSDP